MVADPTNRATTVLLGVDVGGTFTDAVVVAPHGTFVAKRPTTPRQEDGVLAASMAALEAAGVAPAQVTRFAHGTTIATNALLERRMARTALVTTAGFGDVLRIARQRRPSLFDLDLHPVSPVVPRELVVEVDERIGATEVVRELAAVEVERVAAAVAELEVEAVATCLLHAWRDPSHEQRIVEALRERLGTGVRVVASHELSAELREYERACTTAIDAALGPVTSPYLERLGAACAAAGLPRPLVMQSSGGLGALAAVADHPARAVLSGPAGGVVAASRIARVTQADLLACIDVGGTSSDVALVVDGNAGRSADRHVAGLALQLDMLDLRTIGAGGSSIVHVDPGGLLRAGPRSAGSMPGPASWRRGGSQPTLTDCHAVLGNVAPGTLEHWGVTLDVDAARASLRPIARALDMADDDAGVQRVARAAIEVAEADMAEALRGAIVGRGEDPAAATVLAFGGAGGLHACAVADLLGARRVLAPLDAGVLSADGLARADARGARSRSIGRALESIDERELVALLRADLARAAADIAGVGGADAHDIEVVEADCRFAGQAHPLRITADELLVAGGAGKVAARFRGVHLRRFGFELDAPVVLVAVHVAIVRSTASTAAGTNADAARGADLPAPREVAVDVAALDLPTGTLLVPSTWRVEQVRAGCLELVRASTPASEPQLVVDAAGLGVLERRLAGTCEEMGEALVLSAASPNITERRDCSTAVFDASGRLVAQAAHVPVHLGSMQDSVDAVLLAGARPGETWALNDPYLGGTHLPDITLVQVVAGEHGDELAVAAVRAHHADVGGRTPGSMSPGAESIDDEGVRIAPVRIGVDGRLELDEIASIVSAMRDPDERRTDLLAQHAALVVACERLPRLAEGLGGRDALGAALGRLVDHGIQRVRQALVDHLGARAAAERVLELPHGATATIACDVRVGSDHVVVDLTDVPIAGRDSLNAPLAVTRAAASAALRVAIDPDLPAAACDPSILRIHTRPGSRVHAQAPSAVSGGNVEVSSVVFDCVLAALGDALDCRRADGQGTMNDLVLGWDDRAYYETIAGGQGASASGSGATAVHVAMTNTSTTPTESMELLLPVRVERHGVRDGSGGDGRHRGGDGVVRAIRVLQPTTVTFVSQRRAAGPAGAAGGGDGAAGEQLVDGSPQPGMFEREVAAGTLVEVRTPGGGGWGSPARRGSPG